MKLFKKKSKRNKESKQARPQVLDLEALIDALAEQTPKAMEKIMTLAKARREYSQKLKSLQQSINNAAEAAENENDDPDSIETTLEALQALDDAGPSDFTYIETETTLETPVDDKKPTKKKDK